MLSMTNRIFYFQYPFSILKCQSKISNQQKAQTQR